MLTSCAWSYLKDGIYLDHAEESKQLQVIEFSIPWTTTICW